jgi:hypothetical protein
VKFTDVLDVLGILCLVGFVFLIWPPLALAVAGAGILAVSFVTVRGGRR